MNKYLSNLWGLTGILCILFSGCSDKIEPGTTTVKQYTTISARTAVAVISTRPFIYEVPGTIKAKDSTILSGKIMGTVKAINVKEGDEVKKDENLIVLDERQVLEEFRGQLTGYFMVDDADVARFRLMRTGRRFGDWIEVISGLKPGTRYVVSPPAELKNGMKLTEASQ